MSVYLSTYTCSHSVSVSIALDPEYDKSNEVLKNIMANKSGREKSKVCILPISGLDMVALYKSGTLSDKTPVTLSQKVWFDVTYHLCKGKLPCSFWRTLSKHCLHLESDVSGVYFSFPPCLTPEGETPGKMYATPDNPEKCPVRTTSLYLSKLNKHCGALFQFPNHRWKPGRKDWYSPVTIGQENLDNMMETISFQADLSRIYSNASVILTANLKRNSSK